MQIKLYLSILVVVLLGVTHTIVAQEYNDSFFIKNLQQKSYSIDTEAAAIVLFQRTTVELTKGDDGPISIMNVECIIKVIDPKRSGAGNYRVDYNEQYGIYGISDVVGTTYNLNDGKLERSEMSETDVLRTVESKDWYTASFALPNVKKGSVIRYSYKVVQKYNGSKISWELQNRLPKIITEFIFKNYSYFDFACIYSVPDSLHVLSSIAEAEASKSNFCRVNISNSKGTDFFFIRKNVPSVLSEPYIVNEKNYIERVDWEPTKIRTKMIGFPVFKTWQNMNDYYWLNEHIKAHLSTGTAFLNSVIDSLTRPSKNDYEEAYAIFNYVRSHFSLAQTNQSISDFDLRYLYKYKEGSEWDINLFLAAMLKQAGLNASVFLTSPTGYISMTEDYPLYNRIRYMGCIVMIDSSYLLLDASNKNNIFAVLPEYGYNGFAWVLGDEGFGINLNSSTIKEKDVVGVKISDFTDTSAKIEMMIKYGFFKSMAFRKELAKNKEETEKKIKNSLTELPENVDVADVSIEKEQSPDDNLVVKYSLLVNYPKNTDQISFAANMLNELRKNPFTNKRRSLPIEFPYQWEYIYNVSVTLPPNLLPYEIPATIDESCENGDMRYKKTTSYFSDLHTFTQVSTLSINKTLFLKSDYKDIKDFFGKAAKDESQPIVFKKESH